jgi:hypothetical protein
VPLAVAVTLACPLLLVSATVLSVAEAPVDGATNTGAATFGVGLPN